MRHAGANRRSRNRSNNGRGKNGQNRMQVFDSNGPDVRIRGTAHQICEKYTTLAKDARACGDGILAESYLQHAEHYQRIINQWNENNVPNGDEVRAQADNKSYAPVHGDGRMDAGQRIDEGFNEDDLSLPPSILGSGIEVSSEESIKTLEDA